MVAMKQRNKIFSNNIKKLKTMFSLFESKEQKKARHHISNLAALAKADGQIHRDELQYLFKIGEKKGLSHDYVRQAIKKNDPVHIPEVDAEKFDLLYDLVELMLADGNIDSKEMDYCIGMAIKLGFRPAIVGVLVRKISVDLKEGLNKNEIIEDTKSFI